MKYQKDDHTPQIFEPSDEPFIIPEHEVLSEASSCALDGGEGERKRIVNLVHSAALGWSARARLHLGHPGHPE